jgi:hypothetical protein
VAVVRKRVARVRALAAGPDGVPARYEVSHDGRRLTASFENGTLRDGTAYVRATVTLADGTKLDGVGVTRAHAMRDVETVAIATGLGGAFDWDFAATLLRE